MKFRQDGLSKVIIIAIVAVVVLVGAGAGLFFSGILGGGEEEVVPEEEMVVEEVVMPIIYFRIDPPLVVNIGDDPSLPAYLQLVVEVALRDEILIEGLTKHDPLIRHSITDVVMTQTIEDLKTVEGRNVLKEMIRKKVNEVLAAEEGVEAELENVFFSTYVLQ